MDFQFKTMILVAVLANFVWTFGHVVNLNKEISRLSDTAKMNSAMLDLLYLKKERENEMRTQR